MPDKSYLEVTSNDAHALLVAFTLTRALVDGVVSDVEQGRLLFMARGIFDDIPDEQLSALREKLDAVHDSTCKGVHNA